MLSLPTGRLGIVDPTNDLTEFDDAALVCADLAPGDYALEAAVFRPHRPDGPRMRWRIAAIRVGTPGQGVWSSAWERGGVPLGISVDSGTVAVFDVAGRS